MVSKSRKMPRCTAPQTAKDNKTTCIGSVHSRFPMKTMQTIHPPWQKSIFAHTSHVHIDHHLSEMVGYLFDLTEPNIIVFFNDGEKLSAIRRCAMKLCCQGYV